jgi:curved DNA-binding protein CbpA
MRDLYPILNLSRCATSKDIKAAYWALAATPRPNKPQESERELRLVSSGTTPLRWPRSDEPFVNFGRRKRLETPERYKAQKLMLGISK